MAKFEKVSRFIQSDFDMPIRKTSQSAGYDMVVAEDTIIPSYHNHLFNMTINKENNNVRTLDEISNLTKTLKTKPTLVSTGVKCKLDPGTYLELSVRSSCPLKYWLLMANAVGRQRF